MKPAGKPDRKIDMFFLKSDPNSYIVCEEPLFRPPREHDSLIVQATVGCSRNSCAFCVMYKNKVFRVRPKAEVESDLLKIPASMRDEVRKIFLADGNALGAGARHLAEICETARGIFPSLRHLSAYANPYDILESSPGDLARLRRSGLKNLYVGLESGSDRVLSIVGKKGCFADYQDAMKKAHEAGFVLSVTLLLGLGGRKFSREHADESARLVSEASPRFVSTLTTTLYEGSGLFRLAESGAISFQTPSEIVEEHVRLVDQIYSEKIIYRSNHASNFAGVEGILKRDRAAIKSALENLADSLRKNIKFNSIKVGGYHEI